MAEELRGAPVARALTEEQAARTEQLKGAGIEPCLAFVRVGERPDDISYQHDFQHISLFLLHSSVSARQRL